MRYIDLNGNTWDGTKLTSKIRHDDRYGAFITIGWLFSDSVPQLDLGAHDKEIRDKAIEEFAEKIEKRFLRLHPDALYYVYTPKGIVDICKDIAEQMKEVGE